MAQHKYNLILFVSILLTSFIIRAADKLPFDLKKQLLLGQYQLVLPELKRLAKLNNSSAQYQLALCYLHGGSVIKSKEKAEYWLLLAASDNNKASYLLGSLYAKGQVLDKNLVQAKKFLALSQAGGNRKAQKLLKKLFSNPENLEVDPYQRQHLLNQAIKQGDLAKILQLQQQNVQFDFINKQGDTPLLLALKNNQQDIALWLINFFRNESKLNTNTLASNINKQDNLGNSALHIAASKNMPKVSRLLIRTKANINLVNTKKQTPLIVAIMAKNRMLAQQLINEGAKLTAKDSRGNTALMYAKQLSIKLITSFSAKALVSKKGDATLFKQRKKVLELQAADRKSPYFDWPILAIAVAQQQLPMVKYLLKKGYNPWQINHLHENAISVAILNKETQLALHLLNQPLTITPTIEQWSYLFRVAIKYNNLSVVEKLVKLVDRHMLENLPIEQTPLWFAIKYNKFEIFMTILRQFPHFVLQSKDQQKQHNSYLLLAVKNNLIQMSQLLISMNSADSSAKDMYEVDVNKVNLVDKKGRNALWYAADIVNADLVARLLKAKANTDEADSQGYTPLMRAVLKGCYGCVVKLLNYGANPQKQTLNGNSALMFAAQGKDHELALILDRKPDLKRRNKQSLTALMLAVKSVSAKCVKLLLAAGAKPRRKNKKGENSFDLALGNSAILTILNNAN